MAQPRAPPQAQPQPPFSPGPAPDTKIGGEAGMAGVGRRGFHAAAAAAMFTVTTNRPHGPPQQGPPGLNIPHARKISIHSYCPHCMLSSVTL